VSAISLPRPRSRRRRGEVPESVFGYGLVAPALLVTLALLAYPLGYSFWVSLHDVTLGAAHWRWVGLDNYRDVLSDPLFKPALLRTLLFAFAVTVVTLAVGLGFALLLDDDFRGRNLLRGILIIPWSLSQVMLALTFGWIFNSTYGPLNGLLKQFGVIDEYVAWFADGKVVMGIMALGLAWNLAPLATLLFLSALQTVPRELHKAALVDGAGPLRRFALITLPWLRETVLIVTILAALNGFLVFAPIYILTGGGPGTDTTLLSWWGYETGFRNLHLGESAAIFYVMTVLVGAIALLTTWALGRSKDA